MEVFNYSQAVDYRQKIRNPRINKIKRVEKAFFSQKEVRSLKSVFYDLRGTFIFILRNIVSLKKYFWLIPCFVLMILVPIMVVKSIRYSEFYARKINIDNIIEKTSAYVDSAMEEFAFSKTTWFDNEGNIISDDGNSVAKNKYFKEAVSFKNYTVKSGDTISDICKKFSLSNISTLIAVNNIDNVRALRSGQKLIIPNIDGMYHNVKSGESLNSLSKTYGVSLEDLLDVNDLSSDIISKGQKIFIPGARMDSKSLQKALGELFIYPINAKWRLTSKFGHRKDPFTGLSSRHSGIDMACPTGTPIMSTKSGTVGYTGFSNIYGNYVIINHSDGYQSLYAHMSKISVKKGQSVNQGSKIGLVGNTGYSTGPHLHFTVYKHGKLVDPLVLLK